MMTQKAKKTEPSQSAAETGEQRYAFFSHAGCEFFPCHETQHPEDFNCLFCYCPLYALGERCGGNFTYTDGGVKDCTNCLLPHRRENYSVITSRLKEIAALASKRA